MGGVTGAFRRLYGASPLHLLGHLAFFGAAAYAIAQLLDARRAGTIFLWLLAAVLLHDFLLLPVYSTLDRLARRFGPRAVNHLRVPAVVSGLGLLVFFPPILGLNDRTFTHAAGHSPAGYARDWLALSLGAFLVSGVVFLARRRRSG